MIALVLVSLCVVGIAAADKGVLELDDWTFSKLAGTGAKHHAIVAFTEFSWKNPDGWSTVADEFADNSGILVAKVDQSSLDDGSGLKVEGDLPVIKFISRDGGEALFTGDASEGEEIVQFVQSQLSPELSELRAKAQSFAGADAEKRKSLLSEAEKIAAKLDEKYARVGKVYTLFMKRIMEKGNEWIATESERLTGLAASPSVNDEKKADFKQRNSILSNFKSEL